MVDDGSDERTAERGADREDGETGGVGRDRDSQGRQDDGEGGQTSAVERFRAYYQRGRTAVGGRKLIVRKLLEAVVAVVLFAGLAYWVFLYVG